MQTFLHANNYFLVNLRMLSEREIHYELGKLRVKIRGHPAIFRASSGLLPGSVELYNN
jgi:hypothetical protein